MGELHLAVCGAIAKVQAAGLKLVEAAGRVGFAVVLAGGHPRLDVILLQLALPQIARADIHHAIGQFQCLQDILGVLEDLLMEGEAGRCVVPADDDLLDLVEKVNAVQAVRVLAGSARFAAEAGAHGDVFLRQVGFVERFVGMDGRHGHLGRADEALAVALAQVGVVAADGEIAGPVHDRLVDDHGHGQQRVAFGRHLVDGQSQHGLVEHGAGAFEDVIS